MAEGLSAGGELARRGPGLRRVGLKRRQKGYDRTDYATKAARLARVCRRMESGRCLTDVCRDPDLPVRSTVMSWAERYPEFAVQLEAAEAAARASGGAPAEYRAWDEALAEELLARLVDGRGLREVCAEPGMPSASSVTRWLAERPAFREAYRRAREAQADRLFDLAWTIACEADAGDWRNAKLKIDVLKWRIGRLAPLKYGPWKEVAAPLDGADADLDAVRAEAAREADAAAQARALSARTAATRAEAAAARAEALKAKAATAEGKTRRVVVEVRDWATGPDMEVLETTDIQRGLNSLEVWRLHRAIKAGRYEVGPDGALTRVAWRDYVPPEAPPPEALRGSTFSPPPPPDQVAQFMRRRGGDSGEGDTG